PFFIDPAHRAAQERFLKKHATEIEALKKKYKDDLGGLRDALAALKRADALPGTPLSVLMDHIEHMTQVAGIDHVGLGSDFDGVDALPDDLDGIDKLPNITRELLRRGYSDDDVRKILGLNFLRVLEAAETYRDQTRTKLSG